MLAESQLLRVNPAFKSLIPPLAPEEYAQLEANIREDGCRDPLVTWMGVLLDGHNRLEICTRHGIGFDTKSVALAGESEATEWIIRNQFGRRNLPPYERTRLALRLEEVIAARAKARMVLGKASDPAETSPGGETRETIAKAAGVSSNTVAKVKAIEAKATAEVKAALAKGLITINRAHKDIVREERRQAHAALVVEVAANPRTIAIDGPFDLILADPPWRYDDSLPNRAIENQYPTATVEEICAHRTNAAEDSILFLWATPPKLLEALEVMAAWGFKYRTNAVWDKEKVGMGYWFRGQHEFLLVGTKGDVAATPESARVSSVFREARGAHSRKPECVYQWIEQAFPDSEKLEMYCREPRLGWAAWGNEV